jgi:drug/metabolite transporter (DMT)-like permease
MVGVSAIIFGTYILELKGNNLISPFIKVFKSEKIHYVLFSTLIYSVLSVLSKYILGFVDPITYLFSQLVISGLFMLALTFVRHHGLKDVITGFRVHRWTVLLIAVTMFTGQLLEIFAFNAGEASLVMPILRCWTLIAVIAGGTFYKEGHMRNRMLATAIMLVGVLVIYL